MNRQWRLDAGPQTLVLGSRADRMAEVLYWGPPLPENEDLATLAATAALDVTGGMLDENPALSICPETSASFPGTPGLVASNGAGEPLAPVFSFAGETKAPGRLALSFADPALGLRYSAEFSADADTGMITAKATLSSDAPVRLHWLSVPVMPAPQLADEMIEFSGRWCGEFQSRRLPWAPGARSRDNRTGRTGHEHFPGLVLPGRGATNTAGLVWALHYGWSGGHGMEAEELPDGRRQVQFGHARDTETLPGTWFETAPLLLCHAQNGMNGCAVAFQRHIRDRVVQWPEPNRPRPVHYNCWEAVYFNHQLDELKDIATRAAGLGAERFILDDGWFGRRDDDTTSLGDWEVDRRKYPDGLGPLVDHVQTLGMTFGIWFEPEMVNPDSALYRAHPDWALGHPDQVLGRHQMVLDMTRDDVRDHLFAKMDAILSDHSIDYIKWDHNRVLPTPDAAQTRGTYALLDRLRAAHPGVEIESCASGGGRIDAGILARTQRVWLSDSNDALERLRIQHEAALFLPAAVTGSHVGPRRCHTSGRVLDIRFRAWVAAQRHFGIEMDPRELTDDEAEVLRQVTAWWKANRGWMISADILRLDSADPAVVSEQQLSADGARFVVFAGKAESSAQIAPRPLQLAGLDPLSRYRLELRNRSDAPHLSRASLALKDGPVEASGAALMAQGLRLPWSFPQSMWVVEGTRLEGS